MIHDSKLSNTIAKEKQRLMNERSRWYLSGRKGKKPKRKKDTEDLYPMICGHCQHIGERERCIRCPFYRAPDGSQIRIK